MFGINLLLKSYLRPLPLDLNRYAFKKKVNGQIYSLTLPTNAFPVFLRKNTSDIHVFNQVFYRNEYDLSFPEVPKVIVDCGANIGMTSVYFANRYPNATIIAVEPEKQYYEMLLKNTEHYKNIKCLNRGLWNKTANLEVIDRGEGSWAFVVKEVDAEKPDSIKAVSVDEIMRMFNLSKIDVLKIDIEGSEKEIFEEGAEAWIPNVKTMVLELHDRVRKGCTKALINALKSREYAIEPFCESIVVRL